MGLLGTDDQGQTILGMNANSAASATGDAKDGFWNGVLDLFGLGTAGRQRAFDAEQAAIDRQYQQASAERASEISIQEAEKNRDFQEKLANTAHQRAVADLKQAGLNPILAAGNPATTPQGATASGSQGSGSKASGSKGGGEGLFLLASIFNSATRLAGKDKISIPGFGR